ncbi:MAG TPA: HD domain-containing protein [Candidatus Bathyarchaeia archaeon]|nr:HD domain-containing protein [Candidatus Bathyarchaeia archaeon]
MIDLGDDALDPLRRIASAVADAPPERPGVPPRALLVGGFVRDALLGRLRGDADVEVFGLPAERVEEILRREFPGRVNTVGRSFGVFKVHGVAAHGDVDVSLPRTESKVAPGHTGFAVTGDPFLPFAEAARRRDFTVNALALDARTGEVLDAHGGRADLEARVLRAVDAASFPEDPLRVWRAVQLAARLEFTVHAETTALLTRMVAAGELSHLSRERVSEEWRKLLSAPKPSIGLAFAREIGALAACFPELAVLDRTPQDPEWHPEGNVWVHTLLVVDEAAAIVRREREALEPGEPLAVMLGALLHDLGKATTTTHALKDGRTRIVSPRHEAEGEAPAAAVLDRWAFGEEIGRAVLAIVRWHLLPGSLFYARERGELDDRSYANAVRKAVKRVHPVRPAVLLAACEADWRGRALPGIDAMPFAPGTLFADAVAAGGFDKAPVTPLVQGRDVLALGVPAGPEVGRLISKVEAARDRGDLETREQAVELLRRLVREGS